MSKVIGKLTLASILCLFSTIAWTGESHQVVQTETSAVVLEEPVVTLPVQSSAVYETSQSGEPLIAKAMLNKIMPGLAAQIAGVTDQDELSDETSADQIEAARRSKWNVDLFGGVGFGDDQGEFYTTNLSFQSGSLDKFGLSWQPFTGFAVGKNDTAGLLGLDLLLKWPIYSFQNAKLYFEGGGGVQYSGPKSWPNDGSHFNWRPQFGFGLRINPNPDRQFLFGARFIHISNGGTKDYNCNVDEIFLYGGIKIKF